MNKQVLHIIREQEMLLLRKNKMIIKSNGVYNRYKYPILTAEHIPVTWRYDLNPETNTYMMERIFMNATLNSGAIKWGGKYVLVVRVEGADRKSFFAIAESSNGVDNFRFWDYPVVMPEAVEKDDNIYDMRLTAHEDGWIYGIFCTERKDPNAPKGDLSSAIAAAGIARTKDLNQWERLPEFKNPQSATKCCFAP